MSRLARLVASVVVLGLPVTAQTPSFDVASVKPNKSNDGMVSIQAQNGRYSARGLTLAALIRNAYRIQAFQLAGGPDWIYTDRFDVEATYPGNLGTQVDRSRIDLMLRSLLAERFKLAVHDETRELPVYALVFARADKRLGPQLLNSAIDCAAPKGADTCGSSVGPGLIELRGRTMAQLAESLARLTNTGSSLSRLIEDVLVIDTVERPTPD